MVAPLRDAEASLPLLTVLYAASRRPASRLDRPSGATTANDIREYLPSRRSNADRARYPWHGRATQLRQQRPPDRRSCGRVGNSAPKQPEHVEKHVEPATTARMPDPVNAFAITAYVSGHYWTRTSDPLLVRQVQNTPIFIDLAYFWAKVHRFAVNRRRISPN